MPYFKKEHLFYLFFFSLLVFSCKDEPDFPDVEPPAPPTFAEKCCSEPALSQTVSGQNVYLANIFTPNGDGINDFAIIYGETGVQIEAFSIYKNDTVHFSKTNFAANDVNSAWDGTTATGYRNDYFNYSLTVSGKNFQGIISSSLCNDTIPNWQLCQFPAQWNGSEYDPGLPSAENCQ